MIIKRSGDLSFVINRLPFRPVPFPLPLPHGSSSIRQVPLPTPDGPPVAREKRFPCLRLGARSSDLCQPSVGRLHLLNYDSPTGTPARLSVGCGTPSPARSALRGSGTPPCGTAGEPDALLYVFSERDTPALLGLEDMGLAPGPNRSRVAQAQLPGSQAQRRHGLARRGREHQDGTWLDRLRQPSDDPGRLPAQPTIEADRDATDRLVHRFPPAGWTWMIAAPTRPQPDVHEP